MTEKKIHCVVYWNLKKLNVFSLCFHFFWYFKWTFSIGFDGCEKYEYPNIRFLHSNNSSADDVTYIVEGLLVAYQCHTYQAFIVLIKF